MPPSNTTAGTAIEITSTSYSNIQETHELGTTYTVWYKYTFPADGMFGIWGYSSIPGYSPVLNIYGPNSSVIHSIVGSAVNVPAQLWGHSGEEYFFKFSPNAGNPDPAIIVVTSAAAPFETIPSTAIFISDDSSGFPAGVISPVDGSVVRFVDDFPAGESGDSIRLSNVIYAFADVADFDVKIYGSNFIEIASFVPIGDETDPLIRANATLDKIYVIGGDSNDDWVLQSIDPSGTVSGELTTVLIGSLANTVKSFAVANDGNRVYIGVGFPNVLRCWSISGVTFLTNLFTGSGSEYITDILVLEDDTVVSMWVDVASGSVKVRTFNSTGTLLDTFDYGTDNEHTPFQHISYAADSPNSFWLWTHPLGTGTSRFRNVKVSDGSDLVDFEIAEYESGVYHGAPTATPSSRFGISQSCPMFLVVGSDPGATDPNVSQIAIEVISLPPDLGGIYFINPTKAEHHDSYYNDNEKKIPNPTVRTALIGE